MGSGTRAVEARVPGGRTVLAEVRSAGEIARAPRTLRLYLSDSSMAVRTVNGQLIWLETQQFSAFPSNGAIRVVQTTESAIVPRDTGAEARALANLDGVAAWLDARIDGTTTRLNETRLGRATSVHKLVTADGRLIEAARDVETGVVLSVVGRSLHGDFRVQVTSFDVVSLSPDYFLPENR